MMKCLVLLMIEPEQPEALSARKLVVETEKHNVITAYDTETGLDLLRRFPNVDALIVHAHCVREHPDLLKEIKRLVPQTPLVVACPNGFRPPAEADFIVDSHRPDAMVQLLAGPLQGSVEN
jgi:hypothetical protein